MKSNERLVYIALEKCADCGTIVLVAVKKPGDQSGYRLTSHKCSGCTYSMEDEKGREIILKCKIPEEYLQYDFIHKEIP